MLPVAHLIADHIGSWRKSGRPLCIGLSGPQGSGKSTIATQLAAGFAQQGWRVAVLSLDDLYLDRAARRLKAEQIHPLFSTRGVPGTHDVAFGIALLDDLKAGRSARLPRFDKGCDNPVPKSEWQPVDGPVDLILFEGWCLGARPQTDAALIGPINQLERNEDGGAVWRRAVNAALRDDYQALWARADKIVYLSPPDFGVVTHWRAQPERALISADAPAAMTGAQIARFVQHFERISRAMMVDLPALADLVLRLDEHRNLV